MNRLLIRLRCPSLVLIAVAPLVAWAATPGTHSIDILVDQTTPKGVVSIGDRNGRDSAVQAGKLEEKPTVVLDPADSAQLAIVNALPILFNYSADITQTTPTANYAAALKFLEQLKDLAKPPTGTAGLLLSSPDQCLVSYAGVCLDSDLLVQAEKMDEHKSFKTLAQRALSNAVRADTGGVNEDKKALKNFVTDLKVLADTIEKLNSADLTASLQKTPSNVAWQVKGAKPAPGSGTLADMAESLSKDPMLVDAAAVVRRTRTLVFHNRDFQDSLALARDFEAAYKDALELKPVGKTLSYDAANDRVQTLAIGANERFTDLFPPEVLKYQSERTGAFEILYKPYERLSLSAGAGVVYSFVRSPEFTAEPIGTTGQFSVVKKEEDYSALDGVVVLNVTGSKWRLFGVHPFLQVGVVPSSDKLAFLLGGGLQLFDRGALSMGAIYQRVDTLGNGLNEGSTIANIDELTTDKEFKAGFFVGIAVTLK